ICLRVLREANIPGGRREPIPTRRLRPRLLRHFPQQLCCKNSSGSARPGRSTEISDYISVAYPYLGSDQPIALMLQQRVQHKNLAQTRKGRPALTERPFETTEFAQVFIESKNSELFLVLRSLSSRKSIASMVPIGLRIRRSTYIFFSSCGSVISSSLRGPEREMSIAGKVRLSETLRSRISSELPVPLNSSNITSSIRLPVSTSAVAIIVNDPPSSMFRAAPKKRLGRCKALESTPPERILPDGGTIVL